MVEGAYLSAGDVVLRSFRSPLAWFLVLPGTTTSPCVVDSARMPPVDLLSFTEKGNSFSKTVVVPAQAGPVRLLL